VVTRQSRRRWVTVALGVCALLVAPPAASSALAWAATRDRAPALSAAALVARVLGSAPVPYSGLAEIRGGVSLPDLPRLGDLVAELGGTTRARVWWAGPSSWRVSVVGSTGEQGTYRDGDRLVLWDYEGSRLTDVLTDVTGGSTGGGPSIRLPRADDLLPPQAARRLLAAVGPGDRTQALPGVRLVAGVPVTGLRVTPGDPRSTVGHLDVWVEPGRGLPVQLTVVDTHGVTALTSTFLDLDTAAPSAADVAIPGAPDAERDTTTTPDLASRIQQAGLWQLPDTLAGMPASAPITGGAATYGSGLARFVVLPLPGRFSGEVLAAAKQGGAGKLTVTGGEALSVARGMLSLVVARGSTTGSGEPLHAYLIVGLVSPTVLATATRELLAHPPPRRAQ
jgi:outer membrane lipoprotein-sorting protein